MASKPFFGDLSRNVIGGLGTGLILAALLSAWGEPKRDAERFDSYSNERHQRQQREIIDLRESVSGLRDELTRSRSLEEKQIERLKSQIEQNVSNPFNGVDFAREDRRIGERFDRIETDVSDLKNELDRLWDYLLEERRLKNRNAE